MTVFVAVLFVRGLVNDHEIRSGLATYMLLTGATAIGLWLERSWGRGLALVFALGNCGLGALALLAVLMTRQGPWLGPALLLIGSVLLAYVVARPVFNLPDSADSGDGAHER